jgi:UDP-N-acetylmuramoyl-tripeptide--D-alanyl-D-alanine ligase
MDSFSSTRRVIKYGFNNAAHFHASNIQYLGPDGIEFTVNNYYKFNLPIYSSTAVSNALAAIATARILNFEFEEIFDGLKNSFKLMTGRGNFINLGDVYILDHTYNATINSVSKACEALVQFKRFSKNLILVIGSLEDLGSAAKDVHMNIGYYISALPIDTVVTLGNDAALVGEGIRKINHNKKMIEHCNDINALPDLISQLIVPHTTILMIGGRSLNLSQHLKILTDKLS